MYQQSVRKKKINGRQESSVTRERRPRPRIILHRQILHQSETSAFLTLRHLLLALFLLWLSTPLSFGFAHSGPGLDRVRMERNCEIIALPQSSSSALPAKSNCETGMVSL